ncbi:MAG: hypothetical protein B7Y99_03130 [Caulobacterales bacterium 32-69-10]|nr:MAG: hypothetical protein B7Y99_03130 [Caulobacterales bacterium 32-69-10]
MTEIIAFLPCRAGSQRVPLKNTRQFADEAHGLLGVKLRQLDACRAIDRIVLSTNDPAVIAIGEQYASKSSRIVIDHRPDSLCSSATSTDEIVGYVPTIVDSGAVLWTHVTSPMVGAEQYAGMVDAYRAAIAAGTHDSLMSVTPVQNFLWSRTGPLNYDRAKEKWPRTQTLEPLFMVNSAAFLIDVGLMAKLDDRVGAKPLLYDLDEVTAYEVDWEEQFTIAERIFGLRNAAVD